MTELQYVVDGTHENFRRLVLENSEKGAVLVNYWTPRVGPCFRLWQLLEGLCREYQGRFLLVNVNIDKQTSLVRENGITSVPTLKIYHKGDVVESIYGAQAETALREVIDRHVPPAQDSLTAQAIRLYQAGQVDEALQVLNDGGKREPDNLKMYSMAIKLMLREKRYADIESYVSSLPASVQAKPDISGLQVHAKILHLAQLAPPVDQLEARLKEAPNDLDSALSRAALAIVQDEYETALTGLLHILRQDRHYCNQLPRKAMLALFSLLGDEHELTRTYQKAMREIA